MDRTFPNENARLSLKNCFYVSKWHFIGMSRKCGGRARLWRNQESRSHNGFVSSVSRQSGAFFKFVCLCGFAALAYLWQANHCVCGCIYFDIFILDISNDTPHAEYK